MSNYIVTKDDTGDQYFHINLLHHILVFIWAAIEDLNPAPSSPCGITALPAELMAEKIRTFQKRGALCHSGMNSNHVRLAMKIINVKKIDVYHNKLTQQREALPL